MFFSVSVRNKEYDNNAYILLLFNDREHTVKSQRFTKEVLTHRPCPLKRVNFIAMSVTPSGTTTVLQLETCPLPISMTKLKQVSQLLQM